MRGFERLLMRYLRWRGWVVFWLDKPARFCTGHPNSYTCWLALYEEGEGGKRSAMQDGRHFGGTK